MTVEQMIDEMVCMCNDAVQKLAGGQYIGWCARMVKLVQMLGKLKEMISIDKKNQSEVETTDE